jgi:hypothetical protein
MVMGQSQVVKGRATKIWKDASVIRVQYHETIVASTDTLSKTVRLDSGGGRSNTTKLRMNQFANEFCNGAFIVSQRDFVWYVSFHYPEQEGEYWQDEIPFEDGMIFSLCPFAGN